jgi:hypothetical protein
MGPSRLMRPYIWLSLIVVPVVSAIVLVVLLLARADSGYITMVASVGCGWPGGVLINLLHHRWKVQRTQALRLSSESGRNDDG